MKNFADHFPDPVEFTPKQNSRYVGMATKNFYQPMYDLINAQSMWTDAISRWFTQANQELVTKIDKIVMPKS